MRTYNYALLFRDDMNALHPLTEGTIRAQNKAAAREAIIDQKWDVRLEAASCTPHVVLEHVPQGN